MDRRSILVFSVVVASLALPFVAVPAMGADPAPYLVRDIKRGTLSSRPTDLTAIGNLLYFAAGDGRHGRELWRSDGSRAGTYMVANIAPRTASSNPKGMTLFNGLVYFSATNWANGRELWVTDGTSEGTHQVADVRPGKKSSSPAELTVVGDYLYFSADDGYFGRELYRTDGTSVDQVVISGLTGIYPEELTSFADRLYFVSNGRLWSSDGTTAGTKQVKDSHLRIIRSPEQLRASGSLLYFSARTADGLSARHLWRSNGIPAGTRSISEAISPQNLTDVQGHPFFTSGDATAGYKLWTSDGTRPGTMSIKDIGAPSHLTAVGRFLYFNAIRADGWQELRVSDGTTDGTNTWSAGNHEYTQSLVSFNGELYYADAGYLMHVTCPVDCAQYSWSQDVVPWDQNTTTSWGDRDLTVVGNTLFYVGIEFAGDHGFELWAYTP